MKWRAATWCSVAVNLALLATLAAQLRPHAKTVPPVHPAITRTVRATTVAAPTVKPQVRVADFHWSQLEDDDFKVYRDRLRAIDCPELTVRDIMLAVINHYFDERRRAALSAIELQFWDALALQATKGNDNDNLEKLAKPLDDLKNERQKTIKDVLGAPPAADPKEQLQRQVRQWQSEYAWLPADKRDQLVALEANFAQQQQALADVVQSRADKTWTDQDKERRAKLSRQLEEQRRALLSPDELAEYNLRHSPAANWAANLSGFQPTEDEWRAVARLTQQANEARAELGSTADPAGTAGRQSQLATIQANLQAGIESVLGSHRFAEYQRAGDGNYQQLRQVTQRFGLADDVANEAFARQQAATQQANAVRNDASLSAEARQAVLDAIRQQTEQALQQTLGADVLPVYQQHGGQWLQQLNQAPGH